MPKVSSKAGPKKGDTGKKKVVRKAVAAKGNDVVRVGVSRVAGSAKAGGTTVAADVVVESSSRMVSPEKDNKIFYSINKMNKQFIKHASKDLAMEWSENMKLLDSDFEDKFIVQDFSSVAVLNAFLDSLGCMSSPKPITNPYAASAAAYKASGK